MLLHASCVVVDDRAVLIAGPPGAGKSDLALIMMDQGARLLSDDQTFLTCKDGVLMASAPKAIEGLIEIRHLGLARVPFTPSAPVALYVDLVSPDAALERLPDPEDVVLLDRRVRKIRLPSYAVSTPSKIRAALNYSFE